MFVEELALNTYTRLNLLQRNGVFELMRGRTVIDVGCGTGFFSSLICRYAKRLICLDVCQENVEQAKALLPRTNVEFLVSDCQPIQLPDLEVDMVFCTAVIEHLEDPAVGLAEFLRILRVGGKLVLTVDVCPNVTGGFKEYLIRRAESCSGYTVSHPEVHKETAFSDRSRPKFFDLNELKGHLSQGFELCLEDRGGGVFSNIVDSVLILTNALVRPNRSGMNLADHHPRLASPLIRFYTRFVLPIIKLIAAFDNSGFDAFTILLVLSKKG